LPRIITKEVRVASVISAVADPGLTSRGDSMLIPAGKWMS